MGKSSFSIWKTLSSLLMVFVLSATLGGLGSLVAGSLFDGIFYTAQQTSVQVVSNSVPDGDVLDSEESDVVVDERSSDGRLAATRAVESLPLTAATLPRTLTTTGPLTWNDLALGLIALRHLTVDQGGTTRTIIERSVGDTADNLTTSISAVATDLTTYQTAQEAAITTATLTVSGDTTIDGTLTAGSLAVAGVSSGGAITAPYFTATSTTATSTFAGGLTVDIDGLVYDKATGYVGVGTAAPSALFSVAGDIFATGDLSVAGIITTAPIEMQSGVAIGDATTTVTGGSTNIAIGTGAQAGNAGSGSNTGYIAIGNNARALMNVSYGAGSLIAIGNGAEVTGEHGFTIGTGSSASSWGTSVGHVAETASRAVALGYNATVSGGSSVGIGTDVIVANSRSIAIGGGSRTTASNQFVAGSTHGLAGGPVTDVFFGSGVTAAAPSSYTIHGSGGSGTDIAGGSLSLAAGRGTGAGIGGDLIFQTAPAGASGATLNTLVDRMRITSEGNIGIGTTTPSALLEIETDGDGNTAEFKIGEVLITGDSSGTIGFGPGTDPSSLTRFTRSGGDLYLINEDGGVVNLGVGSDVDRYSFEPDGKVIFTADANSNGYLRLAGDRNWELRNEGLGTVAATDSFNIYDRTAGLARFVIDTDGNVGIGTTDPSAQLEVLNATGGYLRLSRNDTSVGLNDELGKIEFWGNDSNDGAAVRSAITARSDTADGRRYSLDFNVSVNGSLSNALTINPRGWLGVNTASPSSDLPASIDGGINTNSRYIVVRPDSNNTAAGLILAAESGNASQGLALIHKNNIPSADINYLDIFGNERFYIRTQVASTPIYALTVLGTGEVSIGTTTPSAKLSVSGDIYADGNLTVSGLTATTSIAAPYFTATDANATSTFAGGLNVGSGGLVYDRATGFVGVGTAVPAKQLEVKTNGVVPTLRLYRTGQLVAGDDVGAIEFFGDDSGSGIVGRIYSESQHTAGNVHDLVFDNQGSEVMRITGGDGGDVRIGGSGEDADANIPSGASSNGRSVWLKLLESSGLNHDQGLLLRESNSASVGFDVWHEGGGNNAYLDNRSGGFIQFRTNTVSSPVDALTILGTGNVGIGDTTPASMLTVGASDAFQVTSLGRVLANVGASGAGNLAYSFVGDTDTGIYNSAADTIKIQTAGSDRVTFSSTYLSVFNTNEDKFHLSTSANVLGEENNMLFSYNNGSAQGARIGSIIEGTWRFGLHFGTRESSGGGIVERMRIAANGNVGIGETAPASRLSVSGGATVGAGYDTTVAPTDGLLVEGNVGIGTTTPTSQLQIGSKAVEVNWGNTSNAQVFIGGVDNEAVVRALQINDENQNEYFRVESTGVGNSDTGRVYVAGLLGIGTTTPSQLLHVEGGDIQVSSDGSSAARLLVEDTRANAAAEISQRSDGRLTLTTRAADYTGTYGLVDILDNGYVGIGTASPIAQLDVVDDANLAIRYTATGDNYVSTQWSSNGVRKVWQGYDPSIDVFKIAHSEAGVTSATNQLVLKEGNVGIGSDAPSATLEVKSTAAFDPASSGAGNSLYIENLAGGTSEGNYGAALTFSHHRNNVPRGAIAVRQSNADPDYAGLSFFTHNGNSVDDSLTEMVRITHDGKISVNNHSMGKSFLSTNAASSFSIFSQAVGAESSGTPVDVLNIGLTSGTSANDSTDGSGARMVFHIPSTSRYAEVGAGIAGIRDGGSVTDGSGALAFYTTQNDEVLDEMMRLSSTGNLSVGTTSQLAKLSIQTTGTTDILNLFETDGDKVFSILENGFVGIGTSTPYATLTVVGDAAADSFAAASTTATSTFAGSVDIGSGSFSYSQSSGLTSIQNLALGALSFGADAGMISWTDMPVTGSTASGTIMSYTAQLDGNPLLTIYGESNGAGGTQNLSVGIGTTTPDVFLLQVAGNVGPDASDVYTLGSAARAWECLYYSGGNLGTCASDETLKQELQPLTFGENALDQLASLKLHSYEFKSAPGKRYNGFIAQEVQLTAPGLVVEKEGGLLAVKYGDVQWLMLEGVQQLYAMVKEMGSNLASVMSRVAGHDEDIATLKERIAELEAQVGIQYEEPEEEIPDGGDGGENDAGNDPADGGNDGDPADPDGEGGEQGDGADDGDQLGDNDGDGEGDPLDGTDDGGENEAGNDPADSGNDGDPVGTDGEGGEQGDGADGGDQPAAGGNEAGS